MPILRNPSRQRYTTLDNDTIRDSELSLAARGLHAFMLSLPDDWDFYIETLADSTGATVYEVRKLLQELESHHYVTRTRPRREDGTLSGSTYTVHERPARQTTESRTEPPTASRRRTTESSTEPVEMGQLRLYQPPNLDIRPEVDPPIEANPPTSADSHTTKERERINERLKKKTLLLKPDKRQRNGTKATTWDEGVAEMAIALFEERDALHHSVNGTTVEKWADEIRLLRRKHSQDEIVLVLNWLFAVDDYWISSGNFLSLSKLRRKDKDGVPYFDRFLTKAKTDLNNAKTGTPTRSTRTARNPTGLDIGAEIEKQMGAGP